MIDVTFGSVTQRPTFATLREYMEAKYSAASAEEADDE